ncbi:heme ABC exporter ATP-binding protein CcmA [Sphingomonas naphthae]|uniref:Heme ABC exporter ATP-binding protein CcmA n=1 Tax=Sphingomonas naphthae TaxID=1813468 RepID=A0ABY7TJC3_9SPHN|nr:heme ABC exporter ATP-binding protein CcmA [Sphingomonas naphthae]WCT73013.1 heme ABC exporter ATP-binding protein CcmA [Sphingomonas naphthae]
MIGGSLALSGVACLRGHRLLFEGLDLALAPGEAALVTGPNGRGKSSLLRIIAGLLRPAAGYVAVEGRVALAAEAAGLDERLPLARALGFWAGIDGAGADSVAAACVAMGIGPLAVVPVRLFSTGQRKRAVLARTIASGAGVWLLDEPGNGLDGEGLALLGAAVAAHRAGGGVVVAASHQPLDLPGATVLAL